MFPCHVLPIPHLPHALYNLFHLRSRFLVTTSTPRSALRQHLTSHPGLLISSETCFSHRTFSTSIFPAAIAWSDFHYLSPEILQWYPNWCLFPPAFPKHKSPCKMLQEFFLFFFNLIVSLPHRNLLLEGLTTGVIQILL